MIRFTQFDSPLGPMRLTGRDDALTGCYFEGQRHLPPLPPEHVRCDTLPLFRAAIDQLHAYFAGRLRRFELPFDPAGTPFQRAVWQAIAAVPFGQTTSYRALAEAVGRPAAARAVGAATGRNPLTIFVPCHRIVGSDGGLTDYAGGLARKATLLVLEGAPVAPPSGLV